MKSKNSYSAKKALCFVAVAIYLLSFPTCSTEASQEETPQAYSIGGTITLSDGGAAAGASVMLVKTSDNSNAGQSPANAAGEYILAGVAPGRYSITVTFNGYETASIDAVEVVNTDVTGKDVTLQKITVPTYSISGAVAKPDGSAAAGASVQIRKAGDNTDVGQATTTGASGAYSVSDIPAGSYHIVITLDGYETGLLAGVTVDNASLTEQNITLQPITVSEQAISIVYSGNDAAIANLPSDGSVTVTKSGADVTVASSSSQPVE
ncbi:MAG: carboxypeptidase-like regulatory domain-containing protein, partial [Tannerella sp.]|nr:carboxypeptidase-like regulatory domain-containing protein [Tannerella sp.]